MALSNPAPAVGMTCTYGTGKTVWEIVKIQNDGTLHLSKVGGDGYTNRWARPDEIRNLKSQDIEVILATVLDQRAEAAQAASVLADSIKRHVKPAKLEKLISAATSAAIQYQHLYERHLFETTGSTEGG